MNEIFSALAHDTRRALLDRLRERDGQTLQALCAGMEMSRQAVSRHLAILERANLVIVRWRGREKCHYLNPVPIRQIHDRWLSHYRAETAAEMLRLKRSIEEQDNE